MLDVDEAINLKTTWLHQVVVLAELQHLRKAARQLGVSAQTLKFNLVSCEHSLGFPLFMRQDQRLLLTPAGSLFVVKARQLLQDLQAVEALFEEPDQQIVFQVGFSSEVARTWLTDWAVALRQVAPQVRLSMTQGPPHLLEQALGDGTLHMLVSASPVRSQGLCSRLATQVQGLVVGAPGLQGSWRDYPYVVCDQWVPPDVQAVMTTDLWFYAILLCQQGQVALYAPDLIVRPWLQAGTLAALPMQPELPPQQLFIAWKPQAKVPLPLRWTLAQLEEDAHDAQA